MWILRCLKKTQKMIERPNFGQGILKAIHWSGFGVAKTVRILFTGFVNYEIFAALVFAADTSKFSSEVIHRCRTSSSISGDTHIFQQVRGGGLGGCLVQRPNLKGTFFHGQYGDTCLEEADWLW
jgi:hypothetical protein